MQRQMQMTMLDDGADDDVDDDVDDGVDDDVRGCATWMMMQMRMPEMPKACVIWCGIIVRGRSSLCWRWTNDRDNNQVGRHHASGSRLST